MSLNKIVIQGRCCSDPELRRTNSGTAVASVTLAVDRDFAPKDGGERETDFVSVVAWKGTGEFLSKYFTKGSMCIVSGRLQMRNYTDKDGNKRTAAEVVADNVYFSGSKKESQGYGTGPSTNYHPGTQDASDFATLSDEEAPLDELPF